MALITSIADDFCNNIGPNAKCRNLCCFRSMSGPHTDMVEWEHRPSITSLVTYIGGLFLQFIAPMPRGIDGIQFPIGADDIGDPPLSRNFGLGLHCSAFNIRGYFSR